VPDPPPSSPSTSVTPDDHRGDDRTGHGDDGDDRDGDDRDGDGGPVGLICPDCERTYDAGPDEPWRCPVDGHPLELAVAGWPTPVGPGGPVEANWPDGRVAPDARDRAVVRQGRAGLWAFEVLLPVARRVSLGEGATPLVDAPGWDAAFKLEYVFPTGSFKDRGATTTLSRAVGLGVDRVLEDSSGNAGTAIATYAARAGVAAEVYVPASAKPSKLRAIERAGATPVRVEGDRQAVTDACVAAVEAGEGWYASHAWNPAFFAGTATVAFEIAAARDWSVPDAVVAPLGHGTLFLGAYRGFRALVAAGWTDRVPRLYGAQATGYAPIVDALHGPATGDAERGTNEAADGIRIREPARREEILAAVEATGGDVVAIDEPTVEAELERLHHAGFYTEPTCAVAPAALRTLRERGAIDETDDVVVPLTGSGLKS
jgi:threonine synthase